MDDNVKRYVAIIITIAKLTNTPFRYIIYKMRILKNVMKSILRKSRLIVVTFVVLFCMGISFVGCNKGEDKIETYGDFLYSVEYYNENGQRVIKDKGVRSGIMIMGLSETGKEKETIAVPEYINDLKVEQLGYSKMWGGEGLWESDSLKKVFFPSSVYIYSGALSKCNNLDKVIFLAHDTSVYNSDGRIHNYKGMIPIFITSYHYIKDNYLTNLYVSDSMLFYFSNISFFYNYDNAPNDGYYWIDDCDYGSRIEYIPGTPVREGYTFDGWYKQAECIDAWDFEKDTLPQTRYTEDNEEIYQETKLYAKWIKN